VVVDGAPIVAGIDDGDGAFLKLLQVIRAAHILQRAVLFEEVLELHPVGDLAPVDEPAAGLEDAPVHGLGEMLRAQEVGDLLQRRVAGEDGADEGLLGLIVDRRVAQGVARLFAGGQVGEVGGAGFHDGASYQTGRPPALTA
jgi:hypothetical protein